MLGRRYPLAPTPGVRHDRGVHPFVLADRTRRLPPPLTVVWADLVAPRSTGVRSWLHLLPDEIAPQVISMREPGLGEAGLGEAALGDAGAGEIVWTSLWPARPDLVVLIEVAARGAETALRFRLESPVAVDDPSAVGHHRRRLNEVFFRDLRATYGQ